MKAFRLGLGLSAALAIGLFAIPAPAHADTYQFFDLGSGNILDHVFGITDSGTAVLEFNVPAGAPLCAVSGICHEYETWVNGVLVHYSPSSDYTTTPPNFVYVNGSPCTVSAPFLTSPVPGICSNGHEVFNAGLSVSNPMYNDATFIGPDPATDLIGDGELIIDQVNLNASGDIVYSVSHHASGGTEEFVEAIDLTTDQVPEPASIFLVSTGLFAAAETIRRRLQSKAK